jgi:DNA polymerase
VDGSTAELRAHEQELTGCTRCGLASARLRVVAGAGPADAAVMVVGEAPGFHEERGADAFAGEGGALLAELLGRAGLGREDVYVTTVLKCRPPASRDPSEEEIAACEPHLFRQLDLVRPRVVLSLGTTATRVLSGRAHPITAVHGRAQELALGGFRTTLLPLYHPAAALYTPRMRAILEEDVACLAELLGRPVVAPAGPAPSVTSPTGPDPRDPSPAIAIVVRPERMQPQEPAQLGLF